MTILKPILNASLNAFIMPFFRGMQALNWYFDIGFDNEGIVCLHKEVKAMRQPDFKYPTVSLKQQSALLDSWISAAVMLSAKHSLVTMTYNGL